MEVFLYLIVQLSDFKYCNVVKSVVLLCSKIELHGSSHVVHLYSGSCGPTDGRGGDKGSPGPLMTSHCVETSQGPQGPLGAAVMLQWCCWLAAAGLCHTLTGLVLFVPFPGVGLMHWCGLSLYCMFVFTEIILYSILWNKYDVVNGSIWGC
jgi:hypothetical protein